jgi:hypothetical protein
LHLPKTISEHQYASFHFTICLSAKESSGLKKKISYVAHECLSPLAQQPSSALTLSRGQTIPWLSAISHLKENNASGQSKLAKDTERIKTFINELTVPVWYYCT